MRPRRDSWLAVVITLAAAVARAGDPDVADLLLKKAKKAFVAKSYEEAEASYRRALKEMTPFPEARLGLAETLEKLGRPADALDACRASVKEIEDAGEPAKWKPLKTRAQQMITRLQGRQGDLARLNESFVKRCIDFGKKVSGSDPTLARKAFETALLVDPDNETAKTCLKQTPAKAAVAPGPETAPKPPAERFGESVIVADLWSGAPQWSVGADSIVGDSPTEGKLFWHNVVLEGRFSIRGRFRVTKVHGEKYGFGVFFGSEGNEPWWAVFMNRAGSVSLERCEEESDHIAKETILDRFDATAPHVLQLDVQPGDVALSIDGRKLFEHNESNRRAFDGKFCLFVQNARIEWTELEVKR